MRKFTLNNLDCANCASKIESEIRKLESVRYASINFATRVLSIDSNDLEPVRKAIRRIEPEVKIIDEKPEDDDDCKKIQHQIVLITASLLLFAGAQLLGKYFVNIYGAIILFLAAYLIAGFPVLAKAARNIFHGRIFDENFLMTLSTIGAFAIQYPAEASAVMIFYRAGEFFQELSLGKSRRSIRSLLEIKSEVAHVMRNGALMDLNPEEVRIGDMLIVKPGERIPVDGKVEDGKSFIDKSALTFCTAGVSKAATAHPACAFTSLALRFTSVVACVG